MANLKFARGTTTPTYSTSGFDDGCIYFNTSNQNIYLRNGTSSSTSTVEIFKGTDTNNIPTYTSTGGSSSVSKSFCLIQRPTSTTSSGNTSPPSDMLTWYSWIGQGVVSSSTLSEVAADYGSFDYAMSDYKSLPPLESARAIAIGFSATYLLYHVNGGSGVGQIAFGYYPYSHVVICHRTAKYYPNYSTSDYNGYYDSDVYPMFQGEITRFGSYSSSSTTGSCPYFSRIDFSLCMNGTNAVSVSAMTGQIVGGSGTNSVTTCYGSSGAYMYDEYSSTYYSNIEKFIYPLWIQY